MKGKTIQTYKHDQPTKTIDILPIRGIIQIIQLSIVDVSIHGFEINFALLIVYSVSNEAETFCVCTFSSHMTIPSSEWTFGVIIDVWISLLLQHASSTRVSHNRIATKTNSAATKYFHTFFTKMSLNITVIIRKMQSILSKWQIAFPKLCKRQRRIHFFTSWWLLLQISFIYSQKIMLLAKSLYFSLPNDLAYSIVLSKIYRIKLKNENNWIVSKLVNWYALFWHRHSIIFQFFRLINNFSTKYTSSFLNDWIRSVKS